MNEIRDELRVDVQKEYERMRAVLAEDLRWDYFPKLNRGAQRKRPGDFWEGLEGMTYGSGIMGWWEWSFRSATALIEPFLRPTGELAEQLGCPNRTPCRCSHRVTEAGKYGLVAGCSCDDSDACDPIRVEVQDLIVHELDRQALGAAVAKALGFMAAGAAPYQSDGLVEIGRCMPVATPAYLAMGGSQELMREIHKVVAVREGPFVLLTPRGRACDTEVEQVLRQFGVAHIALSSVLEVVPGGKIQAKETAGPVLAELSRRMSGGNGLVRTVERIGRDLEAIARGSYQLRRENSELKQLQSQGMFKFALRVDAEDFQAFAAVIALGNRKAAAEFLNVPLRSFYDRIDRWPGKGPDYARMFRMLEWRKTTGRKGMVRLQELVMSGSTAEAENPETLGEVLATLDERDSEGYGDVLRQVLEGLEEQDGANWAGVRDELISMLKEEVPE